MPYTVVVDEIAFNPQTSVIDDEWFGVVQTGFNGFRGFSQQFEEIGGRLIRWPGGTLSELQTDVYDITTDVVFDGRHLYNYSEGRVRPSLTEMFEYAVEHGLAFSLIIPTLRYVDDLEAAIEEINIFMERLVSGYFGPLPDSLTLEIGNEYYGLDTFAANPSLYGEIADVLISEMAGYLTGTNIQIAIQAGVTHSDNVAIISELGNLSLSVIDTVIVHSLPISRTNLNRDLQSGEPEDVGESRIERFGDYLDDWQDAVNQAGGNSNLESFLSAWTVGSSAHNANGLELEYYDFGLRAAGTVLELFAAYSSIGVDAAAAWGVDVTNLNSFSEYQDGEVTIHHMGVMFDWLAENVNGMQLVGEYTPQAADLDYFMYTFSDTDAITVFVVAADIEDLGDSFSLDLSAWAEYEITSITSLGSNYEDGYNPIGTDQDQLYEVVDIDEVSYSYSNYILEFGFDQNDEIIMITLEIDNSEIMGTSESDHMVGSGLDEIFDGLSGNDSIGGMGGDDYISGNMGSDSLSGNNGDDTLDGGMGSDIVKAGPGSDHIIYGDGADLLLGEAGDDTFQLETNNTWGEFYALNTFMSGGSVFSNYLNIEGYLRYEAVIDGGFGHDEVILSDGNDIIFLHDSLSGFYATVQSEIDSFNYESAPRLVSIESIRAGGGNDIIDLTSPDFSMGDISLYGEGGDDIIWSSHGNDSISGGAGSDILFGGLGTDTLHGGSGADEFQFTLSDSGDVILDFDIDDGDTISIFSDSPAQSFSFDSNSDVLSVNFENQILQIEVVGLHLDVGFTNWDEFINVEI